MVLGFRRLAGAAARNHTDGLSRHVARRRCGFVLCFFASANLVRSGARPVRRAPLPRVLPHRAGFRLRADLHHRLRPRTDGRRAGDRRPHHRRPRQAVRRGGREHRHEAGRWARSRPARHGRKPCATRSCRRCLPASPPMRFSASRSMCAPPASWASSGPAASARSLLVAIRKFYYTDVSAILLMIIVTVVVIDMLTERLRHHLIGLERSAMNAAHPGIGGRLRPPCRRVRRCRRPQQRHPGEFRAPWSAGRLRRHRPAAPGAARLRHGSAGFLAGAAASTASAGWATSSS